MFKLLTSRLVPRVLLFRKEVVLLWQAFMSPHTPFYLKAATAFVAFYLVSPIDIISDFIPILGWVDDLILVPLMVSWIVARLPVYAPAKAGRGETISGRARRL